MNLNWNLAIRRNLILHCAPGGQKDGLLLFGPPTDEQQPESIRYGLVGSPNGIKSFKRWLSDVQKLIPSKDLEKAHFQYWPGFSSVFNSSWSDRPIGEYVLNEVLMSSTIKEEDRHQAIYKTVSMIEEPITKHIIQEERQPDIWFVIVPDEVYLYGRPKSVVPKSLRESSGRTLGKAGAEAFLEYGDLFDNLFAGICVSSFQ